MPRTVVIGLDGAAWHLLEPMIDEGFMPRLAALRARGASGILRSTMPPVTPPAWTSAATGVNPGRHGVHGFTLGNAQHEHKGFVHSGLIKAPTIWEMANAQGRTVGVFNLPLTFPPQKLDGWMVSGMMTPGIGQRLYGFAYPSQIEQQVLERVPNYVIEIKANQEQDWRDAGLARRALASVEQRYRVLRMLLEEHITDVVFAVIETPDRLQHLYYRYMDPNDEMYSTDAAARIRPEITRCFEAMDRIVGLLDDYAGGDGGVIVCSDHGFTAWEMSVHTNTLLQSWGYLRLRRGMRLMQHPIISKAVSQIRRVMPVNLRRRARDKSFSAIDWGNTKAFATVYYQQGVLINVRGREPFGIVDPGETQRIMEDIADRFYQLRGPDGRRVTDKVWRAEEILHGHAVQDAPDLIVELQGGRIQLDDELFHGTVFTDHTGLPRGAHHPDGMLAVTGPGVRAGGTVHGSILDVTPTLLYLSGLELPEGLDGSVLEGAFEEGWFRRTPIRWGPLPSSRVRHETSPYSKEDEQVIEESLRGLGYL